MRRSFFRIAAISFAALMMVGILPAVGRSAAFVGETPMAGLTLSLNKYCKMVLKEKTKDDAKELSDDKTKDSSKKNAGKSDGKKAVKSSPAVSKAKTEKNDEPQPERKLNLVYDRLGMANVKSYLNVRKKPSTSSKIVGKMTRNSGCNIYYIKKGWAKIVSGKVKGFVKASYLLKDKPAEKRAYDVARLRVKITTETLNVRYLPTLKSRIYDQISIDEEYTVGREHLSKAWLQEYMKKHCKKKDLKGIDLEAMYADLDNWVLLTVDDEKMFVSKDFVEFEYSVNRAVQIKTEKNGSSSGGGSSDGSSGGSILSRIVSYAMQFLGNRYVWGGTSLTNGTDCSGFVMRIYEHFGYYLPRVSASQASATRTVSASDVRLGDLFFYGSGGVSHVALYIGNGQIIHASNSTDGIKISSAYYRRPIKIGRVIN